MKRLELNDIELKEMSLRMRKRVLNMALYAGNAGAHLGGSLSCVEILAALYGRVMRYDAGDPKWRGRDRFILSKGHAAPAYYAALMEAGFIDTSLEHCFKANGSMLGGHPCMDYGMGVEFSSGSLGMGLSIGSGVCMALEAQEVKGQRVFVLLGDGECNEGSVWEAAMSAAHYKLSGLTTIVDCNGLQYDGATQAIMNMGDLAAKFSDFGFDAVTADGHDAAALAAELEKVCEKPRAVIAQTVKGKGVSFMEGEAAWHHARLSQKQYEEAIAELGGAL